MNTHTICQQCSGPILRGRDTPANPNICMACEVLQPLMEQVAPPIATQSRIQEEIMELNIQIAINKQQLQLLEQLKEMKQRRVLSV